MARELDRIHLFLLGLAPYAYAVLALASLGAFVMAAYLVLSPTASPFIPPFTRPLMVVNMSILAAFWVWHLAFRLTHREVPKPPQVSTRLSAWIAAAALFLLLLGLWGISLLERQPR